MNQVAGQTPINQTVATKGRKGHTLNGERFFVVNEVFKTSRKMSGQHKGGF
jgi:hypothetical protein